MATTPPVPANALNWGFSFNRLNPAPLDGSTVFASLQDFHDYLDYQYSNAYAGQLVSVLEGGAPTVYVIGADRHSYEPLAGGAPPFVIEGEFPTLVDLETAHPGGAPGNWQIGDNYFNWDDTVVPPEWVDMGPIPPRPIAEPPADGELYARSRAPGQSNGTWEPVSAGGRFEFDQAVAAAVWSIPHNLNERIVSVQVVDNAGNTIIGDPDYTDPDILTVTFSRAIAGTAIVRR